jgi:tetratricopeptide (TPR) repeat protein
MRTLNIKLLLISTLFFTSNCLSQLTNNDYNGEAIELSNEAIKISFDAGFKPKSEAEDDFNFAITLLEEAIKIDSNYVYAYLNKASVLIKLNRFNDAILEVEKAKQIKHDFVEAITFQGFIFERMNNVKKANQRYEEAISIYEERINSQSEGSISDKSNLSFLLLFTEGKDAAMVKIQEFIKANPENELLLNMEQVIISFDRKSFIDNL